MMKRLSLGIIAGATGVLCLVASSTFSANAGDPIQVAQADPDPELFDALMEEGEEGFERNCAACHGDNGEGGGVGPRLANNPFVASSSAIVSQIIQGYEDHGMPPFDHLEDRLIQAIATYVRNSWGNDYGMVALSVVVSNRPE